MGDDRQQDITQKGQTEKMWFNIMWHIQRNTTCSRCVMLIDISLLISQSGVVTVIEMLGW